MPFLGVIIALSIFVWAGLGLMAIDPPKSKMMWLKEHTDEPHEAAIAFGILGLFIAILGYCYIHIWYKTENSLIKDLINDFYGNIALTFVGITFTVLIIDKLNEIRDAKDEQKRILAQIGSRSNDFALEAVRLASEYSWLTNGTLKNMNFSKANLRGVELIAANLVGVNLSKANLVKSDLSVVDLTGGNLERANLTNAELFEAKLIKANLIQTNFKRARLNTTKLMDADLTQAILIEADLTAAVLNNATLIGVQANNAILTNAHLVGADLTGAVMVNCDLFGAKLNGAILNDTNFSGGIFFDTVVIGAKYNKDTIWPEGFDPEFEGAILTK